MDRTLNSITREIDGDDASRWAEFGAENGAYLCSIQQDGDTASLTLSSCAFSWKSNSPTRLFRSIAAAELMAEALRQAIELACEWDKDAGKPIKDVLK